MCSSKVGAKRERPSEPETDTIWEADTLSEC